MSGWNKWNANLLKSEIRLRIGEMKETKGGKLSVFAVLGNLRNRAIRRNVVEEKKNGSMYPCVLEECLMGVYLGG